MEKLETFDSVPADWGFWTWNLQKSHLRNKPGRPYTNVTLTLLQNLKGSAEKETLDAVLPLTLEEPSLLRPKPTPMPAGDTLKIALPVTFGTIFFLVVAILLWNRRTRRIGLGNVMSRARHGYTGKSRRRIFRRNKDQGIQLDARAVDPEYSYRDVEPPSMPRRDSADLDSLAGSPVAANFNQQSTGGGRNAFRDEVSRQDRQRREDRRY
jgi:hypothetical protein